MKVGLVCPYSLSVPGGVQSHVRELAGYLTARGHEAGILAPVQGDEAPEGVTRAGRAIPVRYNGSVARLAFGPVVSARTRAWLAEGSFDVVHVHEPLAPSTSLLAMLHASTPLVATFHSAADAPVLVAAASGVLRPALLRVRERIAVSAYAAATVASLPGPAPVVVPNGVATGSYRVSRPARQRPRVVFLGRLLEPRKGLAVLAAAAPAIIAAVPEAEIVIAGPGRGEEAMPWFAGVPGVRFAGEVSEAAKADLLASADVYVAPHTGGESFGIILVEAMAAGAAVVASDLPAFRQVLDDGRCGTLVPVGDAPALARAVTALLRDAGACRALGEAGRQRSQQFDWARVGPRIEEIYRRATTPSRVG